MKCTQHLSVIIKWCVDSSSILYTKYIYNLIPNNSLLFDIYKMWNSKIQMKRRAFENLNEGKKTRLYFRFCGHFWINSCFTFALRLTTLQQYIQCITTEIKYTSPKWISCMSLVVCLKYFMYNGFFFGSCVCCAHEAFFRSVSRLFGEIWILFVLPKRYQCNATIYNFCSQKYSILKTITNFW